MNEYEINEKTIAIIPLNSQKSQIIEEKESYIINQKPIKIIDHSCKYFGSSYKGRSEGTKHLINFNYKLPIIVDEIRSIIFFPTTSPKCEECNWISLNKINNIQKTPTNTIINFNNGFKLALNMSCYSLENQILRANYLESKIRSRRNNQNH